MAEDSDRTRELLKNIKLEPLRLDKVQAAKPTDTGNRVADAKIEALFTAYNQRMAEGVQVFSDYCTEDVPEEIGRKAADLKLSGMRHAMLGLAWRIPVISGTGFAAFAVFGFGVEIAALSLIFTIPICCYLVLV